jgi:hypothetical protein
VIGESAARKVSMSFVRAIVNGCSCSKVKTLR